MKGRVIRSFSDNKHGSFSDGDVVDIPEGVDWVTAGFVLPIANSDTIENAAIYPPERAVKKTNNPRKTKATNED